MAETIEPGTVEQTPGVLPSIEDWDALRAAADPASFDTSAGGRVAAAMLADERELRTAHRSLPVESRVSDDGRRAQELLREAGRAALTAQRGSVDALAARVRGQTGSVGDIAARAHGDLERAATALQEADQLLRRLGAVGEAPEPESEPEIAPERESEHDMEPERESEHDMASEPEPEIAPEGEPESESPADIGLPAESILDAAALATRPREGLVHTVPSDEPGVDDAATGVSEDDLDVAAAPEDEVETPLAEQTRRPPDAVRRTIASVAIVLFFAAVVVLSWWIVSSADNWF